MATVVAVAAVVAVATGVAVAIDEAVATDGAVAIKVFSLFSAFRIFILKMKIANPSETFAENMPSTRLYGVTPKED